jgi:uncharacterized circularly permuted ATP-grasp superfamily protein
MSYYNEIFESSGSLRPHYRSTYSLWEKYSKREKKKLFLKSTELFSGEYSQDPFPRILKQDEFQFLRRGVEQRARAIRAFLIDYSGNGKIWKKVMPDYMLLSIINRHHDRNYLRELNPEKIAFPYGPDVIRDREGTWRVIEDSAGVLGGIGDILKIRRTLFHLVPEFRELFSNAYDPVFFYRDLAEHYTKKAKDAGGIPLLFLSDYKSEPDKETLRLSMELRRFGIESTTISNRSKKIITENNMMFLKSKGIKEKIGYLILHHGAERLELVKFLIIARQFTKKQISLKNVMKGVYSSAIVNCLTKGKVGTNFSPGVQFINDKIFGHYVDSMVRHFLKEDPYLTNIKSYKFGVRSNCHWKTDKSIVNLVRKNKDRFVIKQVNDDGGSGVWIGEKESKSSLDKILGKVKANPQIYIAQEFEHLSVLENKIVDLRIHSQVDSDRIIISNTPWGRANWLEGDGKVNISENGFNSPVVVLNS